MRSADPDTHHHPGRMQAFPQERRRALSLACILILAFGMTITTVSAAAVLNASPPASPVKLIFVHHSTGEAWLADDYGGLGTALRDNRYFVSDTNYGWGPGSIGDRTDIGNWWEWFRGPSNGTILAALYAESGQHSSYSRMGSDPGGENRIILFKSCFPNSALGGTIEAAIPPIGSNPLKGESCGSGDHTVANAKGIYNDLLPYFANHPEKLFIVITAPPLSDATYAANARAFNEWLVHDWLAGYPGENVAVFDYYTVLTTNNGTVNKNDLGALTGNHHRFRGGVIEHIATGDNDANPNISEYASSPGDDHPSKAGDLKATAEFLPLLNIAYNRWLASLGTGTGSLSVLSCPGGASVSVDGTARGTTGDSPLVISGLTAGSHTVSLQLAGYLDTTMSATVNTGQTTELLPRLTPAGSGCPVFPADHIWNMPVDTLPVDSQSAAYVTTIGSTNYLHPDFGSGTWEGFPIGIPYVTVRGTQPKVPVTFDQYGSESDAGLYPIPANPPIEGNPAGDADRHLLVVDRDNQRLYELYAAHKEADGWYAGSGAIFDLAGYGLRQETWTSADAAGLAIFPGLIRYEEVAAGEITHAIRFTAPQTRQEYIWPARHYASSLTGNQYPPMGQRFRLKADFDISGYSPRVQVILTALKKYGMVLADNGAPWYIGGVPDERWDNDELHVLQTVPGSAFEAVNVSSLMINPDSGQARTAVPDTSPPGGITSLKNTTFANNFIRWTWSDPADTDFTKVMVFLDGTFRANITKGTRLFNATGLTENTRYTIGTRTVDTSGNINATWVNHTAWTAPVPVDTTPPRSVTSLKNTTYIASSITWTWTDPADADFTKVMVFLDGIFRANVTKGTQTFDATGLTANTRHTVATRTVDASGNINQTWVNHTATTKSAGDTTPPRSVTSLRNTTYLTSSITWTWTDPADADFTKVMVFLDGIFRANVTKGTLTFDATGLTANTRHTVATRTVDTSGNINQTWVNHTATTKFAGDTTPPRSVTSLKNTTYASGYIRWTWTAPADTDFAKVSVFLDGVFVTDVPKGTRVYNATGLAPGSRHTIGTRTVDTSGNINQTWVNHTATTKSAGDTTPPRSITNLKNTTSTTSSIRWTWTDPPDTDFSRVKVYLNGVYKKDVTRGTRYYLASGLAANTRYTISTRTVDRSGNINQTWVNHTATTRARS